MRLRYICIALAALAIGICILLFWNSDGFIRGFMSDVIVVIFIYAVVKSFSDISPAPLALAVFSFAALLELLQYFNAADHLRLTGIARTALGATFDWLDVVAYAVGVLAIFAADLLFLHAPGRHPETAG